MDEEEVTCYSENGIKVFSKLAGKEDKKNQEKQLNSTLIVIKKGKHPRNPEYSMIHDPYNRLFYTFCWYNDGHYLPCPVMVSIDPKEEIQLEMRRRTSVDTSVPERIT